MTAIAASAGLGAVSGLLGAAAMAGASNLEQRVTRRPDSYVPAHTLAHLLGLPDPDADRWIRNMTMHYASGAVAGCLRGIMAAANLRGPWAALMHTNLRLSFDQTLENLTGVGAPPWTQPRDELVLDIAEKAIFALVTGAVADRLIAPRPGSSASRPGLGRRLKGFS
jgi:hypothetical protein